jgi:hypothetical protein
VLSVCFCISYKQDKVSQLAAFSVFIRPNVSLVLPITLRLGECSLKKQTTRARFDCVVFSVLFVKSVSF